MKQQTKEHFGYPLSCHKTRQAVSHTQHIIAVYYTAVTTTFTANFQFNNFNASAIAHLLLHLSMLQVVRCVIFNRYLICHILF